MLYLVLKYVISIDKLRVVMLCIIYFLDCTMWPIQNTQGTGLASLHFGIILVLSFSQKHCFNASILHRQWLSLRFKGQRSLAFTELLNGMRPTRANISRQMG